MIYYNVAVRRGVDPYAFDNVIGILQGDTFRWVMSPFTFVRFVDAVRDTNGVVTGRPVFVRRLRRCRKHDTRYVLKPVAFRSERAVWAEIPGALLPLKRVV